MVKSSEIRSRIIELEQERKKLLKEAVGKLKAIEALEWVLDSNKKQ